MAKSSKANALDVNYVSEPPPNQVVLPSFLEGNLREAFLPMYQQIVESQYGDDPVLRHLDFKGRGSNSFIVGLAHKILMPEARPAIPSDDRDGKISEMLAGDFSTDFNTLIVRTPEPTYLKHEGLIENVINMAEDKEGNVKFPFMVTGFYTEPWFDDTNGYQLKFAAGEDFSYIEDERLDGAKYPSGMKFTKVDEFGLPVFNVRGQRTWYARDDGLSGLVNIRGIDLDSDTWGLSHAGRDDRVIVVSSEE